MTWLEEEGGALEAAALAFMAGCGPQYLRASRREDVALYRAIAEKAVDLRAQEIEAAAKHIRNQIADMLK